MTTGTSIPHPDSHNIPIRQQTWWPLIRPYLLSGELKPEDLDMACAICTERMAVVESHFQANDRPGVDHGGFILPCGHIYGKSCLNTYLDTQRKLKRSQVCPTCRASFVHDTCRHLDFGCRIPNTKQGVLHIPPVLSEGGLLSEKCRLCFLEGFADSLMEKLEAVSGEDADKLGISVTLGNMTCCRKCYDGVYITHRPPKDFLDYVDSALEQFAAREEIFGLAWGAQRITTIDIKCQRELL